MTNHSISVLEGKKNEYQTQAKPSEQNVINYLGQKAKS